MSQQDENYVAESIAQIETSGHDDKTQEELREIYASMCEAEDRKDSEQA